MDWDTGPTADQLSPALDRLTLGRTRLLEGLLNEKPAEKEHFPDAQIKLEEAVAGLRQAGTMDHLPFGLIARACLRGVTAEESGALADLAKQKKSPIAAP